MSNTIEVNGVSKKFKYQTVLDNITVSFESGKIHGIIGRNGSGKTVLFKCIIGFFPVTSGEIRVNDITVGKDADIAPDVGIIIEAPGFLPNYNGFVNLKLLSLVNRKIGKEEIQSAMASVGLDPTLKKHVGKYSLGMRQRLGIAQAIMENPSILLLDEPMNGLDNRGVDDIRTLLSGLRDDGKTIILASHNREDIDLLCDTVHEMDAGVMKKVR